MCLEYMISLVLGPPHHTFCCLQYKKHGAARDRKQGRGLGRRVVGMVVGMCANVIPCWLHLPKQLFTM